MNFQINKLKTMTAHEKHVEIFIDKICNEIYDFLIKTDTITEIFTRQHVHEILHKDDNFIGYITSHIDALCFLPICKRNNEIDCEYLKFFKKLHGVKYEQCISRGIISDLIYVSVPFIGSYHIDKLDDNIYDERDILTVVDKCLKDISELLKDYLPPYELFSQLIQQPNLQLDEFEIMLKDTDYTAEDINLSFTYVCFHQYIDFARIIYKYKCNQGLDLYYKNNFILKYAFKQAYKKSKVDLFHFLLLETNVNKINEELINTVLYFDKSNYVLKFLFQLDKPLEFPLTGKHAIFIKAINDAIEKENMELIDLLINHKSLICQVYKKTWNALYEMDNILFLGCLFHSVGHCIICENDDVQLYNLPCKNGQTMCEGCDIQSYIETHTNEHIVCKHCITQMYKYKSNCPYCNQPIKYNKINNTTALILITQVQSEMEFESRKLVNSTISEI